MYCSLSAIPLLSDLKLPMNRTYSYTGGSLGSMAPRSIWQQNSIWFLAVDNLKKALKKLQHPPNLLFRQCKLLITFIKKCFNLAS